MLQLNGISAWIEVDGKELEQYGVEEDLNQNRVTCWIATQADKRFSVVFRDNASYRDYSLGSLLELDGAHVSGKVLRAPTILGVLPPPSRTVYQSDQPLSAASSRAFKFSKLELTDEDEYLSQTSAHLGEIRIDIYRVEALGSQLFEPVSQVSGTSKVHERSKKAVTHCVSYGPEARTTLRYSCRTRHLDGKVPFATFVFKYRDLGLLQANGIVQKPPPAMQRATASDEVIDLTAGNAIKSEPVGDVIEIVDKKTRKSLAVGPSKRSNSGNESEVKPVKRVKREKKFVPSGEVIDLT